MTETTHRAPRAGEALTGCCRMTPSELPHDDRMTNDPLLVSCGKDPAEVRRPDAFDEAAAKIVASHYAAVSPWDADLAGTAIRNAFAVLRTHPEVKTLVAEMAIACGALKFWGNDCNACGGNTNPGLLHCEHCGANGEDITDLLMWGTDE